MSEPTKKFKKWYFLYGTMGDSFSELRDWQAAKRIAWRAYRKGVADEQKKRGKV